MRTVLSICLCLLPAAGFAASPDCAAFGEIADNIVVERQKGADMDTAILAVAEDYDGNKKHLQPTIPLLADWVYGLPQEQLGDGVGAAFQQSCEAQ